MTTFWDAAGLRRVAELVTLEAEKTSQKEIARRSEVSEQTISNLLLNRYNTDGRIVKPPQPDTLLKVAPHVTNPGTGLPFDPEEFLAIARGKTGTTRRAIAAASCENATDHPYPAAAQELKRLMGDRTVEEAAKAWGIDPEQLQGFLGATDDRAVPNVIEVQRIVKANYPDKLLNRLYQLYEEPQKVNGKATR